MSTIDERFAAPAAGLGDVRLPIDVSTGHSCFPPTRPSSASITVFTDQFAQVRLTDTWVKHCCGGCHVPVSSQGSTNTFADQLPKHRRTDAHSCGEKAATGSITAYSG